MQGSPSALLASVFFSTTSASVDFVVRRGKLKSSSMFHFSFSKRRTKKMASASTLSSHHPHPPPPLHVVAAPASSSSPFIDWDYLASAPTTGRPSASASVWVCQSSARHGDCKLFSVFFSYAIFAYFLFPDVQGSTESRDLCVDEKKREKRECRVGERDENEKLFLSMRWCPKKAMLDPRPRRRHSQDKKTKQ